MATMKLTKPGTKAHAARMEKIANEIRKFLLDKEMWVDTRIYFNGKAYATSHELPNGKTEFAYNDPNNLIVLDGADPSRGMDYYNGDTITMSFQGDFYEVVNGNGFYKTEEEFSKLVAKYGYYYELGNAWNLTLCEN